MMYLQVIPVDYVDVTGTRETGEFIAKALLDTIDDIEKRCGVKVTSCVTDAAANCRKGRRLISERRPDIQGFDCAAHQLQLLVGDYLKLVPPEFKAAIKDAALVITWFLQHSVPLARLRAATEQILGRPLALVQAVATRWNSMLASIKRLQEVSEIVPVSRISARILLAKWVRCRAKSCKEQYGWRQGFPVETSCHPCQLVHCDVLPSNGTRCWGTSGQQVVQQMTPSCFCIAA